jgi:hypothetical protein
MIYTDYAPNRPENSTQNEANVTLLAVTKALEVVLFQAK